MFRIHWGQWPRRLVMCSLQLLCRPPGRTADSSSHSLLQWGKAMWPSFVHGMWMEEICATSKPSPQHLLHASLPQLFLCLLTGCLYPGWSWKPTVAEGRASASRVLSWLTAWSKSPFQPCLLIGINRSEKYFLLCWAPEIGVHPLRS